MFYCYRYAFVGLVGERRQASDRYLRPGRGTLEETAAPIPHSTTSNRVQSSKERSGRVGVSGKEPGEVGAGGGDRGRGMTTAEEYRTAIVLGKVQCGTVRVNDEVIRHGLS